MERIGLFGGSFNPVTCGHLLMARGAMERLALDWLYFIPAACSPFKPNDAPLAGEQRLRLLRLALAGWTRCVVDDLEVRRGGISYTVDTVREFKRRHPRAQLYWLLGADHARNLPQWHQAHLLAEWVEFVVFPRPGEAEPEIPAPFRGQVLEGAVAMGVSASLVRRRLAEGRAVEGLVPAAVAEVIITERLYQ